MNQGRIWCVVNPTIGLPLFLGGVATIALIVHASVLTNTDWMAKYWQGSAAKRASLGDTAPVAKVIPGSGFSISVSPVAGSTSFVVSVTPSDDQAVKQVAAAPIAK